MNLSEMADELISKVCSGQFSEGGRGRKRCTECQEYSGVRTRVCNCGHVFVKGSTNKKPTALEQMNSDAEITDEQRLYARSTKTCGRFIYAPVGPCPADLVSLEQQDVFQFCNDIIGIGRTEGKIYTIDAMKKWIQHKFGYNTKEYVIVSKLINLWYDEMIGVDSHEDY